MKKLRSIISKVLYLDSQSINDLTSPDNTPTWDSFNALLLVSELEQNYNIKFSMEEIVTVKSVKDIKERLKNHGIIVQD